MLSIRSGVWLLRESVFLANIPGSRSSGMSSRHFGLFRRCSRLLPGLRAWRPRPPVRPCRNSWPVRTVRARVRYNDRFRPSWQGRAGSSGPCPGPDPGPDPDTGSVRSGRADVRVLRQPVRQIVCPWPLRCRRRGPCDTDGAFVRDCFASFVLLSCDFFFKKSAVYSSVAGLVVVSTIFRAGSAGAGSAVWAEPWPMPHWPPIP